MHMATQVYRRKEARLLDQKAAPWTTNTQWVMVVVVVTVGYHDEQQIYSDRRKNEGRGEIETNKGMELTLVA